MMAYQARLLITNMHLREDDTVEVTAKRLTADEWEDEMTFTAPRFGGPWRVGAYIDVLAHPIKS